MSSHVLSELERVCDYLVSRGSVQIAGTVDDLLATHRVFTGPVDQADAMARWPCRWCASGAPGGRPACWSEPPTVLPCPRLAGRPEQPRRNRARLPPLARCARVTRTERTDSDTLEGGDGMTATAVSPKRARPRVPAVRGLTWVTWRQHRFALAGVFVVLGGLGLFMLFNGLAMHQPTPAWGWTRAANSASASCQTNSIFRRDYCGWADQLPHLLSSCRD